MGVASQYTSYGRLQDSGRGIANSADQYLHSSITQMYAGYGVSKTFGVQVNVPYIYRSFRRAEGGGIESGKESGLGDISLSGYWTALEIERGDFRFTARLHAGIKLPTGESDRLAEEGSEEHEHEVPEPHHEETPSGVHGHDLALGTGSLDGIVGADFFCQWKRSFFEAGIQYTLRGKGGHSYDVADDLRWNASAGYMVFQSPQWNASLSVRFSGETKGEDDFRGKRLDDTSITTVFVGPRADVAWGERLSFNAGLDLPIRRDNSGVQTVPDFRAQAGVSWRF